MVASYFYVELAIAYNRTHMRSLFLQQWRSSYAVAVGRHEQEMLAGAHHEHVLKRSTFSLWLCSNVSLSASCLPCMLTSGHLTSAQRNRIRRATSSRLGNQSGARSGNQNAPSHGTNPDAMRHIHGAWLLGRLFQDDGQDGAEPRRLHHSQQQTGNFLWYHTLFKTLQ